MNNNFLLKLLKGVFLFPIYIIRILKRIINGLTHRLKFSMSFRIVAHYTILYMVSVLLAAIIVSVGMAYLSYYNIREKAFKDAYQITYSIEKGNNPQYTIAQLEKKQNAKYFIIDQNGKKYGLAPKRTTGLNSIYDIYTIRDAFYFAKDVFETGYFPVRAYTKGDWPISFTMYANYDVNKELVGLFIGYIILLATTFLGLIFMWISGAVRIRGMLKPIYQITKTAQNITTNNLNTRISVSEAKYELKELAITLNNMLDRINTGYTRQKTFVSDVAHELRTPISVVKGYTNLLDRWGKENSEILDEAIEAIKGESDNMAELIENLLFLARHDTQTVTYNLSKNNISELIKEVVRETELIDKKDHIINNIITDNIFSLCDKARIKQAIRIFIDNAIKYTPKGGSIKITLDREDNMAVINIADTGIGISNEELGKIFKRFYRSEKSRSKKSGGHGLGLSIAKAIILEHKGKIKVRSKFDKGTTFIIYIPTWN